MNLQRPRMVPLLTAEQFENAVKGFPRMSAEGKAAAKRVLVDGVPPVEVAEGLELHRQQVHRWVKSIYEAHLVSVGNQDAKRKA